MYHLNPVNLIQSASIAVCILGAAILWQRQQVRGIACFMLLVALAALVNILEESGLTRRLYLISPSFQFLFGPAIYLACRRLIGNDLTQRVWWHFIPGFLALFFVNYVQWTIALGTVSRITYAVLTAHLLYRYKRVLENERSDSEEFSFVWMIWLVGITACFNLVDLIRLNFQPMLPVELNLIGQGVNNGLWLIVLMLLTYQLQRQKEAPRAQLEESAQLNSENETVDDYRAIFVAIEQSVVQQQLFLTERLTLADLAKELGLQSRDVSRAINLVGQKSYNEYINTHRVTFVCDQLKQSVVKSLTDIAFEAGFSSKATFNKTFKQVTGKTPSQYRADLATAPNT